MRRGLIFSFALGCLCHLAAAQRQPQFLPMIGVSVAVSAQTLVVGGFHEAHVYRRLAGAWVLEARLSPSGTGIDPYDAFGYSVAVSGDTVVVGAAWEDGSATGVNGNPSDNSLRDSGAAYVFVRNGTTWSQQAYLKASNAGADDFFGASVAISGDTVVVGVPYEDSSATGVNGDGSNNSAASSGAAYVFVRNGSTWSQEAFLKASYTGEGDEFGASVALSGDTLAIGAPFEDSSAIGVNGDGRNENAPDSGAAYVFVRTGVVWSQQAFLKASNTGAEDAFGTAVAVSGDSVLIGAPGEDSIAYNVARDENNNSSPESGAAYLFTRTGVAWSQEAYIKALFNRVHDQFGISVAISGGAVLVGSVEHSDLSGYSGQVPAAGVAYLFYFPGAHWEIPDYFFGANYPQTGMAEWGFGRSVAINAENIVVGAAAAYNEYGFGGTFTFTDSSLCAGKSPRPLSQNAPAGGGPGNVGVDAPPDCPWSAESNASWLTITSGTSGAGNGTVGFLAAANPGIVPRSGTLTIAGRTFTVNQAANVSCSYTLNPASGTLVPAGGGGSSVAVVSPPGCGWTAGSNASWLSITSGSSGSGNGVVQYSLSANPGPQRAGAITIAGRVFTVVQAGIVNPTQENSLMLSQLAGGGSEWHSTVFVTNLSNTPETFTIRFYDDFGLAKLMPIEALGLVDSITDTLSAGQTRRYETGAAADQHVAWALLTPATAGTARLAGYAVFRQTLPAGLSTRSSEAAVDFIGVTSSKYALLYDNLDGFVTTAAFVNPDALSSLTIQAEVLDEEGRPFGTNSITLPPLGHMAFVIPETFSSTASRRGSIRLTAPAAFAGLGLRFSPFQTFTSFRFLTGLQ